MRHNVTHKSNLTQCFPIVLKHEEIIPNEMKMYQA